MSMNSLPRTLTPEMVAAASTLVKIAHAGDTSLSRACDRAQERLFSQPWAFYSGILEIASLSNPGDVRATDGNTCTCPTSKGTCYHVAGHMILSSLSAAGIAPMAPLPLPVDLDEDELPAESFLDGPFDMFDDDSLTRPICDCPGCFYAPSNPDDPDGYCDTCRMIVNVDGDEGREWYSDIGGGDFEEVDSLDAPVESQETRSATEQPFYEETPVMVYHALPRRRAVSTEIVPAPGSEFARLTALVDELAA